MLVACVLILWSTEGSPPSMAVLPRRGHGSQQGQGTSCCFASSSRGPALDKFGWSTTAHPRTHSYASRLGPCFLGVERSMKGACAITCSIKSCVKTPWNLSATTVTEKAKRNDYFSKKWLRSQQRVSFPNQTVLMQINASARKPTGHIQTLLCNLAILDEGHELHAF